MGTGMTITAVSFMLFVQVFAVSAKQCTMKGLGFTPYRWDRKKLTYTIYNDLQLYVTSQFGKIVYQLLNISAAYPL